MKNLCLAVATNTYTRTEQSTEINSINNAQQNNVLQVVTYTYTLLFGIYLFIFFFMHQM